MLLHTTLLLKTLGESCSAQWFLHFHTISFCPSKPLRFFVPSRWTLLVGLSWRRPALHPWNELWLCDGGGTRSGPNTSFSGRNRSPGVSSPAVDGPGGPADCLQPHAFPGPLLLLYLVDCCLSVLHLPLWPLLPSVSNGGIASATHKWQPDLHRASVHSIRKDWLGTTEAYWWLCSTTPPSLPPSPLWPPLTTSQRLTISSELLVQLPVLPSKMTLWTHHCF